MNAITNSTNLNVSIYPDINHNPDSYGFSLHFIQIPPISVENPFILLAGKQLIGVDKKLRIVDMNTARILYENDLLENRVINFEPTLFGTYKNTYIYLTGIATLRAIDNRETPEKIFVEIRVKCL